MFHWLTVCVNGVCRCEWGYGLGMCWCGWVLVGVLVCGLCIKITLILRISVVLPTITFAPKKGWGFVSILQTLELIN